ncbi:four helix bundle protein [Amphritea sp. HPY]|uniref:four helix bundle protein n=1 Tax=Amphritea sp. HPY TaxID=3421652 RepID=UPI003D7C4370
MSYEDLDVWKRACRLSCEVYTTLSHCRDFGFRDQITRSGLSIPSNIAEGFERGSVKEKRQFLFYAKGSLAELKTQVYIGQRIGYIHSEKAIRWRQELDEIQKMLAVLIEK